MLPRIGVKNEGVASVQLTAIKRRTTEEPDVNEAIDPPTRRLGRTVVTAPGASVTIAAQTAPAGAETHAVDGRAKVGAGRPETRLTLPVGVLFDICTGQMLGCILVANPLVLRALVDSQAVEGDWVEALLTAVASSGDNRLWDDLASPLPRPSDAPSHPQLAARAS
jgi:hypothetical protein